MRPNPTNDSTTIGSGECEPSALSVQRRERSLSLADLPVAKKGTCLGAMKRRHQALEMRLAGHSYRQIARALGTSVAQSFKDVQKTLGDLPAYLDQRADEIRKLELMRPDALSAALWPRAIEGDVMACAACLKVMERRSKLLGLDAQASIEPPAHHRRPLQNLTDEELLQQLDALRVGVSKRGEQQLT